MTEDITAKESLGDRLRRLTQTAGQAISDLTDWVESELSTPPLTTPLSDEEADALKEKFAAKGTPATDSWGDVHGVSTKNKENPFDPWANLSTYACHTCRYFVPKDDQDGRCRRNAPTMSGYPVVYPTDWCGDHKLGTNPSRGY